MVRTTQRADVAEAAAESVVLAALAAAVAGGGLAAADAPLAARARAAAAPGRRVAQMAQCAFLSLLRNVQALQSHVVVGVAAAGAGAGAAAVDSGGRAIAVATTEPSANVVVAGTAVTMTGLSEAHISHTTRDASFRKVQRSHCH